METDQRAAIANQIREIAGSGAVSSSEDDLAAHSYDASPMAAKWRMQHLQPFRPDLIVRPTAVDQVSRLLTWASGHGVPGARETLRHCETDGS